MVELNLLCWPTGRRVSIYLSHEPTSLDQICRCDCVSLLSWCYVLCLFPSCANRQFRIIWGIVCMCLAAPKNFAGFATVRFLLGFSEGAVSPAFVTITSIWYRKKEHNVRTALWISMNGLAQVLGCFLMYGIGKNSSLPIAPWRVLFIICGAITSAAGVAFFFLMPNGLKDAWFLSAREREVLSLRMAQDRDGGDKSSFSVAQLKEAIMDPKAWVVFWFGVLVCMQSPVLTFASLVIKSIGYTNLETMLYTAPSGAVQIALLWIGVGLVFILPNQRTLVILILIIPPLIGTVFLMKLDVSAQWGLIVASWLVCISIDWARFLLLTHSISVFMHYCFYDNTSFTCGI